MLKDAGLPFKITWKFFKQTSPYNPVSGRCNLFLWEKYFIVCKPELATLNKRNELATSCRHANKFLLKNFQPTITTRYQLLTFEPRALTTVKFKFKFRERMCLSLISQRFNDLFTGLFYLRSAALLVRYETN